MSSDTEVIASQLNILSHNPLVAGADLADLDQEMTPTSRFFVRNHFPTPNLELDSWALKVEGHAGRTVYLDYDYLKNMPSREVDCLLECAGNSRAAIQPPIEGLLWDHGGVGTARWKGVPLREVLERAGSLDLTTDVLLEGADRGTENGMAEEAAYAMSIPLEKALDLDTILAYEMNGQPLLPDHGFPVRAIIPGWYGMTSVKWVQRVSLLTKPHESFHEADYYVYVPEGEIDGTNDGAKPARVTSMAVKSLITWPTRGLTVSAGAHTIRGMAWSGEGPISKVEVSVDNGSSWQPAQVKRSKSPYSWQKWEFVWEAAHPGHFLVRARATDVNGRVQPDKADWNFRGFANNSIHAVPVSVKE